MNHHIEARAADLPECAECGAAPREACRSELGTARAPHAVRLKAASGELVIIKRADARRRRLVRAIDELAAACRGGRR